MNVAKPKRSRRRKCSTGILASDITREQLEQWFHLPSSEACTKLGVSLSVLKRVCRKQGIARWPYRAAAGGTCRQLSPASSCPSQPPTPPSTFIAGNSVPASPCRCAAQQQEQQEQQQQELAREAAAGLQQQAQAQPEAAAALWQHLQQQPPSLSQQASQQLTLQLTQQPSLPIEPPCPPQPVHKRQVGSYNSEPEPMETADNTPQASGLDALAAVAAEAEGPIPGNGWEGATSSERGGTGGSSGGHYLCSQEESSRLGDSWQSSMAGLVAGPGAAAGAGPGGFVVCMDPPSPCQAIERPLSKAAVQGGAWQVPHLFMAQAPLSYLQMATAAPLAQGSLASRRHASAFQPWAPQQAAQQAQQAQHGAAAHPKTEPGRRRKQACGARETISLEGQGSAAQELPPAVCRSQQLQRQLPPMQQLSPKKQQGEAAAEQEPMMAPRGSGWSEASLDPREGIAVADVAGATPTYISRQPADLSFSFMPSMPSTQQGMPAWQALSPFSAHAALASPNPNAVWIPRTCNSWDHILVEVHQRQGETQAAEQAQQAQQAQQQAQQVQLPQVASSQCSAPGSPTAGTAAARSSGALLARLSSPPPCPPLPLQQQLAAAAAAAGGSAAKPAPAPAPGPGPEEGSATAGNGLLAVAGEARTLAHILEQGAALLQGNPQHPLAAQLEAAMGDGRSSSPALPPSTTQQLLHEVRGLRQLLALQCLHKVAAKKGYMIQGIEKLAHARQVG